MKSAPSFVRGLPLLLVALLFSPSSAVAAAPNIQSVDLIGTVNPATAELVVSAIHQAERAQRRSGA